MARIYKPVWDRLKQDEVVVLKLWPTAKSPRQNFNRIKKLLTKEKYLDVDFNDVYSLARLSFKLQEREGVHYLRATLDKSINFSLIQDDDIC